MAIGLNSIYRVKWFQQVSGQNVVNIQHYFVDAATAGLPPAEDIAFFWWNAWDSKILPHQSSSLSLQRVEVDEVNGVTFAQYVPGTPTVGGIVSVPVSPFAAVGIRQNRHDRTTRNGYKRIGGVPTSQNTGGVLQGSYVTAFQTDAPYLFDDPQTITDQNTGTLSIHSVPIIWGGNDPLYPLGRMGFIDGLTVNPNLTTQNSRKIGHGD